jgi:hypothetical protein
MNEVADRSSPLRVLYVGGWGRSGSTLLDRLIGQVPGFFSMGEMRDFFLRGCVENRLCGCGEAFLDCPFWTEVGRTAFGGWHAVDAAELAALRPRVDRPWYLPMLVRGPRPRSFRNRYRRYVAALAAVYYAVRDVSGAHTVVDSSKIATFGLLVRGIPGVDLRVLHLVRDGRGVVFSWRRHVVRPDRPDDPDAMIRYGLVGASIRYDVYNAMTETFRWAGTPYVRMRYEDLVSDPATTLRRIATFAGASETTLGSIGRNGHVELGVAHTVDGNPMRFARGPLEIRKDDRWTGAMSDRDRRVVNMLTAPMLVRYGYGSRR